MQEDYRISFLFSSHDRSLMGAADDLVILRDGVIQSIQRKPPRTPSGADAAGPDSQAGEHG
jgi:putative ABC transport system ATP-binding protein